MIKILIFSDRSNNLLTKRELVWLNEYINKKKRKSVIERSRNFSNRIQLYTYNLWEKFGEGKWKSKKYLPYRIWKWCGNNLKVFGNTYWERCEKMNSVKRLL